MAKWFSTNPFSVIPAEEEGALTHQREDIGEALRAAAQRLVFRHNNNERLRIPNGALTGSSPGVAQLLQSLETVLCDGLFDDAAYWDYLEHSLRTLPDAQPLVYSSAVEHVTAVQRQRLPNTVRGEAAVKSWSGRSWLLLNLTSKSLLDAFRSLRDMTAAYYQDTAFLMKPGGHTFLLAICRHLGRLDFELGLNDVRHFTTVLPKEPAAPDATNTTNANGKKDGALPSNASFSSVSDSLPAGPSPALLAMNDEDPTATKRRRSPTLPSAA
eukprot:TRINITY_DN20465_c0_g1_i1.p1 TRINITY_DN20465_c0_g1~~TRINITY_DN20465_c0_g1_i1.p1  ORF type:complete len:270 (-),score=62.68 TRINITY_DN20465_c0_g1_i1:25-834(-)